jgi:clan AA aspartic protease
MGLTYANIRVENLLTKRKLETKALVDSGAVFFTMPEHLAVQLGFDLADAHTREVVLADGSRKSVPMVGPLRVYFADRCCDLSVLILGDEPLFGAVPMEMMDLIVHPASQTLTVNPDSPYVPVAFAK